MSVQLQLQLPSKPPSKPAEQGNDGKVNVLGKRLTPEDGYEALSKAKQQGRLPCWAHLSPVLKPVDEKDKSKGQKVVLNCDQCQRDLAPSNVSQLSNNHFDSQGNCKYAAGKGKLTVKVVRTTNSAGGTTTAAIKKTTDPETNRVQVAPVKDRRMWWANFMAADGFPFLAAAARRLLAMHTTACAAERNWSVWGQVYTKPRNRLSLTLGEMIVYIKGNLRATEGQDELLLLEELAQLQPLESSSGGDAEPIEVE